MTAEIGAHPTVESAKTDARKRARAQRAVLHASANATGVGATYHQAADVFFQNFPVSPGTVVAVYLATGHEFDTRPIVKRLPAWQAVTVLPVVVAKDQPLIFRVWNLGDPLVPGAFKIPMPEETQAVVVPDIVLVPLVAFDATGMRLGQGGGFYDRTLPLLREQKPDLTVVGLAFEGQQVESVPHDALDQRLDAVVTEQRCHTF